MPYDGEESSSGVQRCSQEEIAIAFLPLRRLQIVSLVQSSASFLSLVDVALLLRDQDYHLSARNVLCEP